MPLFFVNLLRHKLIIKQEVIEPCHILPQFWVK